MKKQNKKSQKKHNKYNGRNIYGQRCIAKDLKLEPGIAYQQAIQMIDEVLASKDKIEYTLDWSALSDEEMDIVQEKMTEDKDYLLTIVNSHSKYSEIDLDKMFKNNDIDIVKNDNEYIVTTGYQHYSRLNLLMNQ